jgi:hypothetical protein
MHWRIADEQSRRATGKGTNVPMPYIPDAPNEKDYVAWYEYETNQTKQTSYEFIQLESKSVSKSESFYSKNDFRIYIPKSLIENSTYENYESNKNTLENAAIPFINKIKKKSVESALKNIIHRNVSSKITKNLSTYNEFFLPIWKITYEENNKSKYVYIDEINEVIFGDGLNDGKEVLKMLIKHSIFFYLFYLMFNNLWDFGAFITFIFTLIFYVLGFAFLKSKNDSQEDKRNWIKGVLNFFYINEINQSEKIGPKESLIKYIDDLVMADRLTTYNKARKSFIAKFKKDEGVL